MVPERASRVVVTGVGTVSAVGIGGGEVLATLPDRASGVGPIRGFSTETAPSHLAAEVGDLEPFLEGDERRRLARASQLTVVACRLALADAALEPGALPGLGLVLGSQWGDFRSSETFASGFLARGPLGLSPLVFPNTVMNVMAAQAAIAVSAQGPMLTLNEPGVAAEIAVARAAFLVAAGRAPAVLAGGVDELCPILYHELGRLRVTSPRDGGPEGCWPFDRRANGSLLGEGATFVVLESAASAAARGARIYAELRAAAWGNLPSPARGFPPPRRRSPAVVERALAVAGIGAADVDAAYLTGGGDPAQDACELDLIERVFDPRRGLRPRLTALTPLVGEHAGLGGLKVAAAAVATLCEGRLPVLPELREPIRGDLALAGDRAASAVAARHVLVHGLSRGGGHVALILSRDGTGVGARVAA